MHDRDYDGFFDEKATTAAEDDNLMTMLGKFDKPPAQQLRAGSKVKGKITRMGKDFIFVDVGGRIEAALKTAEVTDKEGNLTVKVGDEVESYVSTARENEVMLTMSVGGHAASTSDIVDVMRTKVPVQGKVTGVNKGGLQVKVLGKSAFCPMSAIELRYVEDVNVYLNKSMTFVIDKVTEGGKNIVLSRIPLLEMELRDKLTKFAENVETKKVLSGPITRIADFGLFVDVGGFEGLVHISEVSWTRAENLAALFNIGQTVEYVVLKVEQATPLRNTKISLSMKQAQLDPWTTAAEQLQPGMQVEGTITRLANFGAFVELIPGVEGLIHVSEMTWSKRVNHPQEVVKVGDRVRVTILAVQPAKRNVSCSLKDVSEDPWKTVPEEFPVGKTVTGKVASQQSYGFFVDLADGVTGLLPHAQISEDRKGSVKVGSTIEVSIYGIDLEKRRISLSLGLMEAQAEQAQTRQALDELKKKAAVPTGGSEFGDALRNALLKKTAGGN